MRSPHTKGDASGFVLLEAIGYLFILAILVNVSLSLTLTTKRLADAGELAFDRIRTIEEIGQRFTSAVRASDSVMAEVDALHSDESHLLLARYP